jgi:hypothetical protein
VGKLILVAAIWIAPISEVTLVLTSVAPSLTIRSSCAAAGLVAKKFQTNAQAPTLQYTREITADLPSNQNSILNARFGNGGDKDLVCDYLIHALHIVL